MNTTTTRRFPKVGDIVHIPRYGSCEVLRSYPAIKRLRVKTGNCPASVVVNWR